MSPEQTLALVEELAANATRGRLNATSALQAIYAAVTAALENPTPPRAYGDRRCLNRHAPTMQLWQGDEPDNVRLYMEPIEDEDVYHPVEPLVRPPIWFGAVGSSTL
jgi:hypothetical protein